MLKGSLTWRLKSLNVRTGGELERLSQELTLFRSERKDVVADRQQEQLAVGSERPRKIVSLTSIAGQKRGSGSEAAEGGQT